MKRSLSFVGILSTGFLLAGCGSHFPSACAQSSQGQSLRNFDNIVISGPVDATVIGVASNAPLSVEGSASDAHRVDVSQQDRVLYVHARGMRPVPVTLDVPSSSTPLNITVSGNNYTKMRGDFLIQKINASGNAQLDLYWLNTSHLTINATDSAKVFLAGVATNLDVNASRYAEVNAKYLRVENSYVKATDHSNVGVNVENALGTQSSGKASVYYYRDPALANLYLKDSGSALRMKGISGASNDLLG